MEREDRGATNTEAVGEREEERKRGRERNRERELGLRTKEGRDWRREKERESKDLRQLMIDTMGARWKDDITIAHTNTAYRKKINK